MQVNVFIARQEGKAQNKLLLLPNNPSAAIQHEYQSGWTYYATLDTADAMFEGRAVDVDLAARRFAVVLPQVPDRR